jgi:hypothetical protein
MSAYYPLWRLDDLLPVEQEVGCGRLYPDVRPFARSEFIDLILTACRGAGRPLSSAELRRELALAESPGLEGAPSGQLATQRIWRALQAQQLLRISMEALLNWVLSQSAVPATLTGLRASLLKAIHRDDQQPFGSWLRESLVMDSGADPIVSPVDLLRELASVDQVEHPELALSGLRAALRICDNAGDTEGLFAGQPDRLPLKTLAARATRLAQKPLQDVVEILLSEWIIGQHIYWAVGRSGDQTQRLRMFLDEGGWKSSYANPGNARPTPDRLDTLLNLAADCAILERASSADGNIGYRAPASAKRAQF